MPRRSVPRMQRGKRIRTFAGYIRTSHNSRTPRDDVSDDDEDISDDSDAAGFPFASVDGHEDDHFDDDEQVRYVVEMRSDWTTRSTNSTMVPLHPLPC